ncbi:MAG: precorrin-2 C(20)-methyltransferase [Rhodospirillales bacterium]|nr:precorrin-2 C(20)-methyltransferase [Rhodospirillales bacterium]
MSGTLFGLGIGPGDPDLITLKALKILQKATVIAYPAPDKGDSLARSIVESHLPGNQEEIIIRTPMVAGNTPAHDVYDEYAVVIEDHLEEGRDVAVLCEGDPFFYGSFMYIFERLAHRYDSEIIPGVSSLMACAAQANFPLASRKDILTVLPGPLGEDELERRLADTDAAAIMKVGRHLDKIVRVLKKLDLTEKAIYVEHATMTNTKTLTIAELEKAKAPYFSMILVQKRGEAWV